MTELEGLAPSQRDAVGPLSADKLCVGALGREQKQLGRGPEEEGLLGTGPAPGSVGASPTAPRVQFWIMSSAQKAKSPKLRYCSFFFPVSKRLLAKKTMAA